MAIARLERLVAAIACAVAASAGAAELGTLFTTPEERARLDRMRRGESASLETSTASSRAPVVTGYVKRSDGRSTVWIDGIPVSVGRSEAAKLLDPRAVDRPVPTDGTLHVESKPAR